MPLHRLVFKLDLIHPVTDPLDRVFAGVLA